MKVLFSGTSIFIDLDCVLFVELTFQVHHPGFAIRIKVLRWASFGHVEDPC